MAIALVVALLAAACSGGDGPSLADPDAAGTSSTSSTTPDLAFVDRDDGSLTLRVSVPRLSFVAPHVVDETNSAEVLTTDLLTDGLTELDPLTGEVKPGVASSWTVSDDRLVWTFRLREMTFSTGAALLATDVMASLNRVAAMGIESLSGPNLSVVAGYQDVADGLVESMTGVVEVDERTVQITLDSPYEPLPELLAAVPFGIFPVAIDTTGSLPVSSSVRFRPTAMWETGLRMSAPSVEGEISVIELWADGAGRLLESGDVDLAVGLTADPAVGLRSVTVARSADAFFAMNAAIPPFDDPNIRAAIVKAVDQQAIVDEFFPTDDPMLGFVPEEVAGGSTNACAAACRFRPGRASRLVRESPVGDTPLTVDYFLDGTDDDSEQRLAVAIVGALRDAGLVATARAHSIDDYGTRIAEGELGLFRFGSVSSVASADAELAGSFLTSGSDNVTSTSIEAFDALIAQARAEIAPRRRADLYAEAEQLLMQDLPVLPLVRFTETIWLADSLDAAVLELDGSLDLTSVEFARRDG